MPSADQVPTKSSHSTMLWHMWVVLIQAEARTSGDQVEVVTRMQSMTAITCPESLVRYVIRTHESVILDDASKPNLFSGDNYLRDRQSKSVLCLPLIKQRELAGVLLL